VDVPVRVLRAGLAADLVRQLAHVHCGPSQRHTAAGAGQRQQILDEPAHPDRLGVEVGEPRSGVASRAVSIRTIGSATAGPARSARQTP